MTVLLVSILLIVIGIYMLLSVNDDSSIVLWTVSVLSGWAVFATGTVLLGRETATLLVRYAHVLA
jgi:hypothetical protein